MENKKEKHLFCYKYPHPAVTTDCVIFGFDGKSLNVLLIRRGLDPFKGRWAFPGGFLKPDESADNGARRELQEETGLENIYIEQFHTYSAPGRDPRERVITIAYIALSKTLEVRGGDDAAAAAWFPIDEVPQLAFDHELILRDARRHLRERIHFRPIGHDLLPEKFTLRELQTLYEAILEVKFDRRNFANKFLRLGLITPIEEVVWPTPHRAAQLYSFNLPRYLEFRDRGFRLEF